MSNDPVERVSDVANDIDWRSEEAIMVRVGQAQRIKELETTLTTLRKARDHYVKAGPYGAGWDLVKAIDAILAQADG